MPIHRNLITNQLYLFGQGGGAEHGICLVCIIVMGPCLSYTSLHGEEIVQWQINDIKMLALAQEFPVLDGLSSSI